MHRDYELIRQSIRKCSNRDDAMQFFVDAAWPVLHPTGISWIGFYLKSTDDTMTLGPRRDKPACSPIGLHGACGKALLSQSPLVVKDVVELGDNYIACDPRDRSEVVIPLIDESGACWGVLDVDSHDVASFSNADVTALQSLLEWAALTKA
jgi:putative methionine-R-sulfoxide reductase with GAF domain